MTPLRKAAIAVALAGSTLTGGALGAYLFNGSSATAATNSTATTPATSASGSGTAPAGNAAPSGTFHSNENAAHEAGESAAREAQEDAGQFPTVP